MPNRNYWLVSSFNLENIKIAQERLVWGFWDRCSVTKQGLSNKLNKNWRDFISLYNRIKEGDIVFFQTRSDYSIHGFGVVSGKYFDDQTPIWPMELKNNKVFFPWRVTFYLVLLADEKFLPMQLRRAIIWMDMAWGLYRKTKHIMF